MNLDSDMVELDGVDATNGGLGTDETELSPRLQPDVLGNPEGQRRRAAIQAALFGGPDDSARLGRYRLLEHLGVGGMGMVYAAYDEQLDRKIAIKIIHLRRPNTELRERTLREARALARLSHPNVVHVYEAGELDEQLFVAMEFLAGPTLRTWIDGGARPWQEILATFCAAGDGLAAAHASGIVHRDFKPHNAMFGADGRVRVLDFGLARFDAHEREVDEQPTPTDEASVALTRTGTIMGTPAYMAPEQLDGQEISARSDQFAFCVALFEALYGVRPFVGQTLAELREALVSGTIQARPRDTEAPRWVHAVLLRGLARDPAQRWPSMNELLAALRRDPARRRRAVIGAALVALVAGSSLSLLLSARETPAEICPDAREEISTVWSGERAAGLRASLSAKHGAHANDVMATVEPRLDRYANAWAGMRNEACRTHASGHQSDHVFDRRTACLDQRLRSLLALVLDLEQATLEDLDEVEGALATLPEIAACADTEALLADTPVEERQWIEHEVHPSETLESIAAQYGTSAKSIAIANQLRIREALEPGQTLRVHALRLPLPPQRLFYTTVAGDSWPAVAERFAVSESALRAFNSLLGDELEPGTQLLILILPEPPQPRELELELELPEGYEQARSIQTPEERLEHGVQLAVNEQLYHQRQPQIMWSNGVVAKHLPAAVAELRTRYGFAGTLVISDISKHGGGDFPPHKAHRSGREVDIWLPMLPGVFEPERLRTARRPELEEVDWFGVYGLLAALQQTGKVEVVLLQWELQANVHAAGKLMGASDEELGSLLTWPRPKNADPFSNKALVRPADGYGKEIHVRFAAEL